MRSAKAQFFTSVEAHAAKHIGVDGAAMLERDHRRVLRSEGVAQVAEFFYVLKYAGIPIPDGLASFLERHNADMDTLEQSCRNGYTVGGLSAQRVRRAKFSDAQIRYVMHESSGGEPRFDQQSLQRIFTQIMSFESCRSILVTLSDFGLLRRWEFNQVVIGSTGILEDLYKTQLETIVATFDQT
ncbi:hypothetical protein [Yoonia sp. GPGPB17]|uniref:hypothetical protein n=1 Tax=Yoonia sp. GPGPB17 TaxID=3026147 RepID=UPI0030EBD6DC